MNQRQLGGTGIEVTEVGLGCWQLGGDAWGSMDEETAMVILRKALEEGVRFFDTADVYGLGRSEELVGRMLKESGEEVFVATKVGRWPEPGWPGNFSKETVREHTEASLRRLGVGVLDLTQLHCLPMGVIRQYGIFDTLRELKEEGKIRNFGASVESVAEALECLEEEGLVSLQVIFNIFRQKPAEELFNKAREKGVGLIVRLPLASGLLAGKFTHRTEFAENDHRRYNQQGQAFNVGETFAGLGLDKGVELADAIRHWVPAGMSMAQMAVRWILDFEAVSVVIPGASKVEQVESNAACSELPRLDEELYKKLRAFYKKLVEEHVKGKY